MGLLWDKFILNEENVLKIKPFIFNLIHNNCCEEFSYVDEQLYNFNEEINLAADNIYGNLEDISQELKSFYLLIKTLVNTLVFGDKGPGKLQS